MYEYTAIVDKVVDGDTIDISIDLGFSVWTKQRIRLAGIDAAEHNFPFGEATAKLVREALESKSVRIQITKPDKYGRYLGTVFLGSDKSINDQLIKYGIVKEYNGESKAGIWTDKQLAVAELPKETKLV